jgi:glycerophosphoryl diester phosphodiesterase
VPHPSGRPWIVAHRGASRQAQENTLEAFLLARDLGADSVELDARRTADGVIVVHHDDTLQGEERPIVAMTRSEVARAAPFVPDLGDVITACTGMWIDVEIKNDPREADWDPDDVVATAIAAAHGGDDIVVTSFNPGTVATARRAGLRTGMLLGSGFDPAEMAGPAAEQGHEFLLPHWSTLDGDNGSHIIEAARRSGIEVAVWTVDDPIQMRRLAELGVGAICTNAPDVAASALVENRDGVGG